MRRNMSEIAFTYTSPGKIRKTNQDALIVESAEGMGHKKIILAAVCDGMGGYHQGEIASSYVVNDLSKWFKAQLKEQLENKSSFKSIVENLEKRVYEINKKIQIYSAENEVMLGTTAVIYFQIDEKYSFINIGDSRGYILSEDYLRQVTKDQSLMQQRIEEGLITQKEAVSHPDKSVVLQGIGISKSLKADIFYGRHKGRESVLLCSDGFWRKLETKDIKAFHKAASERKEITKEKLELLGESLMERGETDNLSAVIIKTW